MSERQSFDTKTKYKTGIDDITDARSMSILIRQFGLVFFLYLYRPIGILSGNENGRPYRSVFMKTWVLLRFFMLKGFRLLGVFFLLDPRAFGKSEFTALEIAFCAQHLTYHV